MRPQLTFQSIYVPFFTTREDDNLGTVAQFHPKTNDWLKIHDYGVDITTQEEVAEDIQEHPNQHAIAAFTSAYEDMLSFDVKRKLPRQEQEVIGPSIKVFPVVLTGDDAATITFPEPVVSAESMSPPKATRFSALIPALFRKKTTLTPKPDPVDQPFTQSGKAFDTWFSLSPDAVPTSLKSLAELDQLLADTYKRK